MQFKFDPTQFDMRTQPKPIRRRKEPEQTEGDEEEESGPSKEKKIRLIWPDSGSENSRSRSTDSFDGEVDQKNKARL